MAITKEIQDKIEAAAEKFQENNPDWDTKLSCNTTH